MLKQILFGALVLGATVFTSCEKEALTDSLTADATSITSRGDGTTTTSDLTDVAVADLPAAITAYITANYATATIKDAHKDASGNIYVDLSTGVRVKFDANNAFVSEATHKGGKGSKGDKGGASDLTDVAVADLPAAITTYITTNYATATIKDAHKDASGNIYVDLSTGVRVKFDANNAFVSATTKDDKGGKGDKGGASDLTDVAVADLPAAITTYITTNYATATIKDAHKDASGNIYVDLSTGVRVKFDANNAFVSATTKDDKGGKGKKGK